MISARGIFLDQLQKNKGSVVALLGLNAVQISATLLLPWPLKLIVDKVIGGAPYPVWLSGLSDLAPSAAIAVLAIAALILAALYQGAYLFAAVLASTVGARMRMSVAKKLFGHLQTLDLVFFSRAQTGDLTQRVANDAGFPQELLSNVLLPSVSASLSTLLMLAVLVGFSPILAIVVVLSILPLPLLVRYFHSSIVERSYEQSEAFGGVMAFAEQSITAMQIIQGFNREDIEDQRFRQKSLNAVTAAMAATTVVFRFNLSVGFARALGAASVVLVGGYLVLAGSVTVGTLIVVLSYLEAIYGPVNQLANVAAAYGQAMGKGRRITKMWVEEATIRNRASALPFRAGNNAPAIRLEKVSFAYPDGETVLENIDMAIASGETLALVGPTGAGKSTIAALVTRLLDPAKGRILIDGRDLREFTVESLRAQCAMVMQDPFLLPTTIRDNIALFNPDITEERIVAAAKAARLHDFVLSLREGYHTVIGERGKGLSGGQRQRLSIARAIARNPRMLILDEPTSALDVQTESEVLEALEALEASRQGRTTLIIAHRPSTLRLADRVVRLQDGKIQDFETMSPVVNNRSGTLGL